MKKIILISDLLGGSSPSYIQFFRSQLNKHFEISYYDVCLLAGIDSCNLKQKQIHQQFVNGGIDTAVNNLLTLESKVTAIIGFSMGGTIAWKAIHQGLDTQQLYAISATRLRFELVPPDCNLELIFGATDPYLPNSEWFEEMNLTAKLIEAQGHEIYKSKEITRPIISNIISRHLV